MLNTNLRTPAFKGEYWVLKNDFREQKVPDLSGHPKYTEAEKTSAGKEVVKIICDKDYDLRNAIRLERSGIPYMAFVSKESQYEIVEKNLYGQKTSEAGEKWG
jgi:hypothetical protein